MRCARVIPRYRRSAKAKAGRGRRGGWRVWAREVRISGRVRVCAQDGVEERMERRSWVSSGVVERRSNYSIFAGPRRLYRRNKYNPEMHSCHICKAVSRTLPPLCHPAGAATGAGGGARHGVLHSSSGSKGRARARPEGPRRLTRSRRAAPGKQIIDPCSLALWPCAGTIHEIRTRAGPRKGCTP